MFKAYLAQYISKAQVLADHDACSLAPEICLGAMLPSLASDIYNLGTAVNFTFAGSISDPQLFQLVTRREFVNPDFEKDGEGREGDLIAVYRTMWETFGSVPAVLESSPVVNRLRR